MNTDILTRCDCGNTATDTLTNGQAACEWCAGHEGHAKPDTVRTFVTWVGTRLAECSVCGWRCGYWECGCDLVHACEVAE